MIRIERRRESRFGKLRRELKNGHRMEGALSQQLDCLIPYRNATQDPACALFVPRGTMGMNEVQYLTIGEVAALIRKRPKTVRNLMSRSVFCDGVHYFRPRGSTPLFKRDAVIQWIEGRETAPQAGNRRSKGHCSVDLSLIPAVRGKADGL